MDTQNLVKLLDQQIEVVVQRLGGPVSVAGIKHNWLISKRQIYKGEDYLSQIEKNAVYFAESSGLVCLAISQYLQTGKPSLKEKQIAEHVDKVATSALTIVQPIVAFLKGHEPNIQISFANWDWYRTRSNKQTLNQADYVAQVEWMCLVFGSSCVIAETYFGMVLDFPKIVDLTKSIDGEIILGAIRQRTYDWSKFCVEKLIA